MLEKLRKQLDEKRKELRSIMDAARNEARAFTEDEGERIDALEGEIRDTLDRINRQERLEKLSTEADEAHERLSAPVEKPETPDVGNRADPSVKMGSDREADRPFESLGEQLRAIVDFSADGGQMDKRQLRLQHEYRAATGHNELIPSDGGFLVQTDFSEELYRNMHETGNILSRVRRIPLSANSNGVTLNAVNETSRQAGSRWGGVRGYWMDEAGALTASQPHFRQIELKLKKLGVLVYATQEILDDARVLGSVVSQAATEEIVFLVESGIFAGTGAGKPLGIINSSALVSVAKQGSQAADTIVSDNLFKMYARMPAMNRRNAVWLINNDCLPELFNLADAEGQYIYQPEGRINSVGDGLLLGRPVLVTEHNATIGDQNDILFVDLSQYAFIDKGGVRSESSIHVRFLFDEQAFRFIYRLDGQPIHTSAITQVNAANPLSPYVTLDART